MPRLEEIEVKNALKEVKSVLGNGEQKTQLTDSTGNTAGVTAGALNVNITGGGSGGGPATIADGADVAEGSTTDAAATDSTSAWTGISLWKGIWQNTKDAFIALTSALISLGTIIANQTNRSQKTQITDGTTDATFTGTSLNTNVTNTVTVSGSVTVSGTVAATQSGNWSVRLQDGSGNNINSTSNALNTFVTNTVTVSGTVAATQSGTWTVNSVQSGTWTVQAVQSGTWTVNSVQSGTWTVQAVQSGTWTISNTSFGATGTSTPTDAFANPTTAILSQNFLMGWNGATWDRLKSNGGNLQIAGASGSITPTTGTATTTDAQLLAANANRKYLYIQNLSSAQTIYIRFGSAATTADKPLAAGNSFVFESSFVPTQSLHGITGVSAANYIIWEG